MMNLKQSCLLLWIVIIVSTAQYIPAQIIPKVYSDLFQSEDGQLYIITPGGQRIYAQPEQGQWGLKNMYGNPRGTETGIHLDFNLPSLNGTLYYGFMNYEDSEHPQPVYFRRSADIVAGQSEIPIVNNLVGKYDMVDWQNTGKGTLGYRVLNEHGMMLYDGRISFKGTAPFEIDDTLIEGPFVNNLTHLSAIISFTTNKPLIARVRINDKEFGGGTAQVNHAIEVSGLNPYTTYTYEVIYGDNRKAYALTTAPAPGSRKAFTFAYASDSRSGRGGGEREIYGVNAYIMKKISALNAFNKVAFMQFTGDLIDGYLNHIEDTHLQYANWKRAIEAFAHYYPVYVGMGNHEALVHSFRDDDGRRYRVDRFPFDSESAEQIFAEHFIMPKNGPDSEDGSIYDPDPQSTDFPSYKGNVYYYMYDNMAMVVLNSNYWFAPGLRADFNLSGNLHGYIMDNQLQWLKETIRSLEADAHIDHIFVTVHTPFFPNGGHVYDDMWYGGNNLPRPFVAGKPVRKGIIERRDELLEVLVNQSQKVVAILTGDEHNYNRLMVTPQTEIYPPDYEFDTIALSRTIWQINNGAAGAPYYAQEETPWTPFVYSFTTQNAVVYIHIEGQRVTVEVMNPDTLEMVDRFVLRK